MRLSFARRRRFCSARNWADRPLIRTVLTIESGFAPVQPMSILFRPRSRLRPQRNTRPQSEWAH